ncbi:MAG: hypothetical protein A2Y76_04700 [Planctomycetes bacterium RBG_13_60_9]|nr:MAG: hypothetical protein A2Y76_04700 [Planctomycetes bacterium RBG_13_60_9]
MGHLKSAIRNPQAAIPWHLVTAALYVAFAIYLYRPHLVDVSGWRWLLPVNAATAALGAYVLSRRWVAGFTGSLLAGLVYGFGPFLLGLAKFHPTASLLAAGIPWLFVPAALLERRRGKWLAAPLWLLPFAVVALFFYLSAGRRLFAAPLHVEVRVSDLAGFIAPLALVSRSTALLGVYHVPVAALALGLAMIWKARRYGFLLILTVGFLLAFCWPFIDAGKVAWLAVSPILWLSIPMAWCAVLSGIGLEGLIESGPADRKWILAAAIVLGILAIVALLLAAKCFQIMLGLGDGYGRLFVQAALIYLVGAIATTIIFFMTRQNLRLHWLRWAILCTALATDIFLGARYIVDHIL